MYYKICPHCGAHLDPGEKCDCVRKEGNNTGNDPRKTQKGKERKTAWASELTG